MRCNQLLHRYEVTRGHLENEYELIDMIGTVYEMAIVLYEKYDRK